VSEFTYIKDGVHYRSEQEYLQLQETARANGAANKARWDAAPGTYPKCNAEPPLGPEEQCGGEDCPLHNILWLELEGFTHEQAIALSAVYDFCMFQGYGPVADALGGMDEFNNLTEMDPAPAALAQWYTDHYNLVYYIMEVHHKSCLWDYWWQAQTNSTRPVPERGTVTIHLVKDAEGNYQPYFPPDLPLVVPEEILAWSANWDAVRATMSPEQQASHVLGRFEYAKYPY